MARPRKPIDWTEFDKLCFIQCTQLEISAWFHCSVDTIERAVLREKKMGFAEYYDQKKGHGKISLRRRMFETASKGNPTMQIWLSKQYFGMSDKQEIKSDIKIEEINKKSDVELLEEIKKLVG